MNLKIKIPVKFESELLVSIPPKMVERPDTVRLNARQILCSFSKMLTQREKMALHWLAEGLTACEIAKRFQIGNGTPVENRHSVGGKTRSFPISSSPDVSQETILRPPKRLGRFANTSATSQNENPS